MLYACNNRNTNQQTPPEKQSIENKQQEASPILNPIIFQDYKEQINQVVRTTFQDSKSNLWFGTENGVYIYNGQSLTHRIDIKTASEETPTIKDITESKDGSIWFGHTHGISRLKNDTVTNYNTTVGLISDDVWSINADSKGKIWIGTIDGVSVFNGKEFSNFELPEGEIDKSVGVSSTRIVHDIMEDSKGRLWFCTNAGLFSYADNSLTNISRKFGITSNFINELFEDESKTLWISTKQGLYSLKDDTITDITAGKIDYGKGIGPIEKDKDGTIWFVNDQHFLFKYDGKQITEFIKTEANKGPVIFEIFKDNNGRLWFVGFGGVYRLENGNFINVTKNGPW